MSDRQIRELERDQAITGIPDPRLMRIRRSLGQCAWCANPGTSNYPRESCCNKCWQRSWDPGGSGDVGQAPYTCNGCVGVCGKEYVDIEAAEQQALDSGDKLS